MLNSEEYKPPFTYFPELQPTHLEQLSREILKVVEMTINSHSTPYDDTYTLETSIFGRTRQLFLELDRSDEWPWLSVVNKGMDYVPSLHGLPVRVFRDDPISPRKQKVFFRNDYEQHQLALLFDDEESTSADQLTWRLFIQAPSTANFESDELEDIEDDYRVVLVGYNIATKQIESMWQSKVVAQTTLFAIDVDLPKAKPITRKSAIPKESAKTATTKNE